MSVLHGFRRHERRLARGVLALFCLVWLQLAAAPCRAVHATPADAHGHDAHSVHASHGAGDHAHHAAPQLPPADAAPGGAPCPWCPTQHGGDGCPEGSRCAFPHGPQVDARLPLLFLPPPEAPAYPALPEVAPQVRRTAEERAGPVPRRSFSISYCRFIE
jgi:hypothetical protein